MRVEDTDIKETALLAFVPKVLGANVQPRVVLCIAGLMAEGFTTQGLQHRFN
jgi:hypothetical protein